MKSYAVRVDSSSVQRVDVSPDGNLMSAVGMDGNLRIYSINSVSRKLYPKYRTSYGGRSTISSCSFCFDPRFIVIGSFDRNLVLFHLEERKIVRTFIGHTDYVTDVVCLSKKFENSIVSCSADSTILVWNPSKTLPQSVLKGHKGPIHRVCRVSDDCGLILSSGADRTIRIWSSTSSSSECLKTLIGHTTPISSICALTCGKVDDDVEGFCVASVSSMGGTAMIWDVEQGGVCGIAVGEDARNVDRDESLKMREDALKMIRLDGGGDDDDDDNDALLQIHKIVEDGEQIVPKYLDARYFELAGECFLVTALRSKLALVYSLDFDGGQNNRNRPVFRTCKNSSSVWRCVVSLGYASCLEFRNLKDRVLLVSGDYDGSVQMAMKRNGDSSYYTPDSWCNGTHGPDIAIYGSHNSERVTFATENTVCTCETVKAGQCRFNRKSLYYGENISKLVGLGAQVWIVSGNKIIEYPFTHHVYAPLVANPAVLHHDNEVSDAIMMQDTTIISVDVMGNVYLWKSHDHVRQNDFHLTLPRGNWKIHHKYLSVTFVLSESGTLRRFMWIDGNEGLVEAHNPIYLMFDPKVDDVLWTVSTSESSSPAVPAVLICKKIVPTSENDVPMYVVEFWNSTFNANLPDRECLGCVLFWKPPSMPTKCCQLLFTGADFANYGQALMAHPTKCTMILCGHVDGSLRLYSISPLKLVKEIQRAHEGAITAVGDGYMTRVPANPVRQLAAKLGGVKNHKQFYSAGEDGITKTWVL